MLILIVFSHSFVLPCLDLFSVDFKSDCKIAFADSSCYARIMFDDVMLYKTPYDNLDNSNIYFTLPKTYFVILKDSVNSDFFLAEYMSISGYVKKECVQAVNSTPKNPFLTNINFRVYSEQSRDMRTSPTTVSSLSSQVTYIPLYSRNLTYFGTIHGEALIDGRTDVWYYCSYVADKEYFGYVYSDFCDQFSTIQENTENVTYIANPTFSELTTKTIPQNDSKIGIIVGILFVPALAFVLFLIKGKNILQPDKTLNREISDY